MKRIVWALVVIAMGTVFGCNGKPGEQSASGKKETASSAPASADDAALALKFLKGVQDGDKKAMYEATSLTPELANQSREKLIHPDKYKLSKEQVAENEHALRISGEIDFIAAKIKKLLPKSAKFEVTKTAAKAGAGPEKAFTHTVKITYGNKDEAMRDKSGKAMKEMTVELLHVARSVEGRQVHEISFTGQDFEKMADREFAVISYF